MRGLAVRSGNVADFKYYDIMTTFILTIVAPLALLWIASKLPDTATK